MKVAIVVLAMLLIYLAASGKAASIIAAFKAPAAGPAGKAPTGYAPGTVTSPSGA